MSFLRRQHSNRKLSALSLQTHLDYIANTHRMKLIFPEICFCHTHRNSFSKRMSLAISNACSKKGSLTIEASLLVPIFLFAVISILSFTEILRAQMKINSSLQQTAKELSVYAYAVKNNLQTDVFDSSNEDFETGSSFSGIAISETYVRSRLIKDVTQEYLQASPVKGSGNISFAESKFMEKDRIELRCAYTVTPFFALSDKAGFFTESTAIVRAFTGYDNSSGCANAEKEKYVYITETGRVYHQTRNCHYLDLSIQQTDKNQLSELRNHSGGRYYACPLCAKSGIGNIAYVTDYGDCYHYDLLCSGLKRTIQAIPMSQVGTRTLCSKCGS